MGSERTGCAGASAKTGTCSSIEVRRCHGRGRVRRGRGGQRRGWHDGRADRRAPRADRAGGGEDRPVRRLHRPVRRRHLGTREHRAEPGRGGRFTGTGPRLPGLRGRGRGGRGPAAGAAGARPSHAGPGPGAHPGGFRLGAGLRGLLPGGARRRGRRAQRGTRSAGRPGARRGTAPPQPALPAHARGGDHHPGGIPLAQPGPAASPGHAGLGQGGRRWSATGCCGSRC